MTGMLQPVMACGPLTRVGEDGHEVECGSVRWMREAEM